MSGLALDQVDLGTPTLESGSSVSAPETHAPPVSTPSPSTSVGGHDQSPLSSGDAPSQQEVEEMMTL